MSSNPFRDQAQHELTRFCDELQRGLADLLGVQSITQRTELQVLRSRLAEASRVLDSPLSDKEGFRRPMRALETLLTTKAESKP